MDQSHNGNFPEPPETRPSTIQISRLSIALVERQLKENRINTMRSSAERGIHLVCPDRSPAPIKIQVKGNAGPKPAGGKGKLALDWWIEEDALAGIVALVDLSTERVWLMTFNEVERLAEQLTLPCIHVHQAMQLCH